VPSVVTQLRQDVDESGRKERSKYSWNGGGPRKLKDISPRIRPTEKLFEYKVAIQSTASFEPLQSISIQTSLAMHISLFPVFLLPSLFPFITASKFPPRTTSDTCDALQFNDGSPVSCENVGEIACCTDVIGYTCNDPATTGGGEESNIGVAVRFHCGSGHPCQDGQGCSLDVSD